VVAYVLLRWGSRPAVGNAVQSPPVAVVHAFNTEAVGSPITAMELAMMGDLPAFMKQPANRIAAASQHTEGVEGYVFDGADGSQMGHGLQMWLQTMWFLARVGYAACAILDEPDVYMRRTR
jgi:hypothetical protein